MNLQGLAVTIIGGIISTVTVIAITVLLATGVEVPSEFWGLLATSSGAAVLGGAYAQGASTATKRDVE